MASRSSSRPIVGEVNVDLAGFKSNVEKQFGYQVRWIVGLYVLIGTLIGGGFLLRGDLGRIEGQIAKATAEIEALRRDVTSLQTNSTSQRELLSTMRGEIASGLAEINSKLPSNPAQLLALSADEEQVIRDLLGVPKGPSNMAPKYGIGDSIVGALPFPEDLVAKVPKLKGFRCGKDPNGSVLIPNSRGTCGSCSQSGLIRVG
jgi:hypothetical protein